MEHAGRIVGLNPAKSLCVPIFVFKNSSRDKVLGQFKNLF